MDWADGQLLLSHTNSLQLILISSIGAITALLCDQKGTLDILVYKSGRLCASVCVCARGARVDGAGVYDEGIMSKSRDYDIKYNNSTAISAVISAVKSKVCAM